MTNQYETEMPRQKRGLGCFSVIGIIVLTIAVTVAITLWAINSSWLNGKFKPVQLSGSEQQTLTQKLNALGAFDATPEDDQPQSTEQILGNDSDASSQELQPEVYTEDDGRRRIELTERELNALLAENTDLAEQLVIDLTDNMASVKLLIDLDPDLPFFGGKTLKVSSGTELSYANNRPSVVMRGVSVWGIPIPNAWLGGLKHTDLIEQFGDTDGFWKSFADGIEDIRVEEGKLLIQLAE
ncbi:MAG: arginine N-succinyltransferase [Pseudomonadota bacterium]